MRSFVSLAAMLTLALALLAACGSRDANTPATSATAQNSSATRVTDKPATTPAQEASDGVRRITRAELRVGIEQGTVALFDVRDKGSYEMGHIKGAKLVPWGEVENRLDEFPKDRLIVTYCA